MHFKFCFFLLYSQFFLALLNQSFLLLFLLQESLLLFEQILSFLHPFLLIFVFAFFASLSNYFLERDLLAIIYVRVKISLLFLVYSPRLITNSPCILYLDLLSKYVGIIQLNLCRISTTLFPKNYKSLTTKLLCISHSNLHYFSICRK